MSRRPDGQSSAYDPFGEAVEAASVCPATAEDRRVRNATVAVFWTIALLLTAGRAYLGDHGSARAVAGVQAPAPAQQVVAIR